MREDVHYGTTIINSWTVPLLFCKEEREGEIVWTTKSETELVSNIWLNNFSFFILAGWAMSVGVQKKHNFVGYEQYYFKT